MNIISVYESSFGHRPSLLDMFGHEATSGDVDPMIAHWQSELESDFDHTFQRSNDVYPLVSHHRFNELSLFGNGPRESIGERALLMLFAHDGLVCSDPMWEILDAREKEGPDAAAAAVNALTGRLAEVESLIDAGILRFRSVRPALSTSSREAILLAFGVDADMRAFTNFTEAADTATMLGGSAARSYIDQGSELSFRFGLLLPDLTAKTLTAQVEETRLRVQRLGRALLHLSWQFSVASEEAAVDIALASELETSLFDYLMESSRLVRPHHVDGVHRTRHLLRAAAGEIPNVDRIDLSIADVLAIRNDDTFAGFRDALHAALDNLEHLLQDRTDPDRAAAAFRAQMADASARLKSNASRASFSDVVKSTTVPIGIEAAVAASTSDDHLKAAAITSLGTAGIVIWQWLHARKLPESMEVAIRYTSTLGAKQ